jgi:hypothetical protein
VVDDCVVLFLCLGVLLRIEWSRVCIKLFSCLWLVDSIVVALVAMFC